MIAAKLDERVADLHLLHIADGRIVRADRIVIVTNELSELLDDLGSLKWHGCLLGWESGPPPSRVKRARAARSGALESFVFFGEIEEEVGRVEARAVLLGELGGARGEVAGADVVHELQEAAGPWRGANA